MAMTPRERVTAAMNKENLDRPPAAIFTQSATIGQMDATGAAWPEAHKNAEVMAKLAAAQADVFGFECCRTSFCLTAEAERLGCVVDVTKKDAAPMIKSHPFKFDCMEGVYDDPAALMPADEFLKGGRVAEVIKSAAILKKNKGNDYCIVAGTTGPFTLAGHMVSTENLIFGMMMAPEEVDKWTAAITPYCKEYAQALIDNGADIIQMSEPSGSTDMLAPEMFQEAAGRAVTASLGATNGGLGNILHICGDAYPIIDQMAACGPSVKGISIEEKVDPYKAVEKVGGKTVLVGNVGSLKPLFQGTPEEVKEGVFKSCDAGFNIISSGCGIAPATSDENMRAFVEAVKNFKH
ncbi:MAG: MtaA/CmuA family methyltransferase [Methanomethylophilus sp.]|nr:MtaA/CmuA family methyltransferase [Methanomethylophilus sp.]